MKLYTPFYIVSFIGLLVLSSCQKEALLPVADFIIDNDNCSAPCTVSFTNTSISNGTTKYRWYFGEGEPLDMGFGNIEHRYLNPGMYQVRLVAESADGISEKTAFVSIRCNATPSLRTVILQDYPRFKLSGEPWDQSSSPDIEMRILNAETNLINIIGNVRFNVSAPPVSWSFSPSTSFLGAQKIKIQFWEFDNPGTSEFMGETDVFSLYTKDICRVEELSLTGSNSIKIMLRLQWR